MISRNNKIALLKIISRAIINLKNRRFNEKEKEQIKKRGNTKYNHGYIS